MSTDLRVLLSQRNPVRSRPLPLAEVLAATGLDEESLRATGQVRIYEGEVSLVSLDGVGEAWKATLLSGFDSGLIRQADSAAYRVFNERVHDCEDFRFSVLDDDTIDQVLRFANLEEGRRFLDLGCGLGAMTALVAEETGAEGVGLDFAPSVVERARASWGREGLSFEEGDLDALAAVRAEPFDVALSFDALYFALDLRQTLTDLAGLLAPHGRLVTTYTHRVQEGTVSSDPEDSPLGRALGAAGWDWIAVDITPSGRSFWERSLAALADLEEPFRSEGTHADWEARRNEAEATLALYEAGRARRYVFAAGRP